MKKIMFNDKYGLTDAVLTGRKTMTRRIVTPKQEKWLRFIDGEPSEWIRHGARFLFGEEIAVAQNYKDCIGKEYLDYVAEDEVCKLVMNGHIGSTNKMFVRADLMPHRIRIKKINVERLQDISEDDCLKEGVEKHYDMYKVDGYCHIINGKPVVQHFGNPRTAFANLIDRVSGNGTWKKNPWVFAYSFEIVK